MQNDINVIVVKRKGLNLYLRYTDPVTGKRLEKNSGTRSMKVAQRAAGEWQAELNASGITTDRVITWEEFREDFFDHYVDHRSVNYRINMAATFNLIEDMMSPDKLTRVTTAWIKRFKTLVRKQQKSPATIHKYLQHLRTALSWASDQGYLKRVPKFPAEQRNSNKGKKLMKGRPVTFEEFERMLSVCEEPALRHLMHGLWLSGLRISEALSLTWDQWADGIRIDIDSDGDVFLLIDGDDQKNGEAQLYPVVDDFSDFLMQTQPKDRQGFVFNPCGERGVVSRRVDTVSSWIVRTGKRSGVKVDMKKDRKTRQDKPVFASAHDLRRSFGERWSRIVEPMVLRDLMRHASVETTEKYYVGINAKKTLEHLRKRKRAAEVNGEVNERQKISQNSLPIS